jgi:hypothetical protein
MFPLLLFEVKASFSFRTSAASIADPRQAEVNVMHKKPEGVTYRLSDPNSDLLHALIILVALGVMAVSTCCLVLLLLGLL